MRKISQQMIRGIIVLFMLGISPLTVNYSYSEEIDRSKDDNLDIFEQKDSKERIILTERMVDGKLELSRYELPKNVSPNDMERMLSFEDNTVWTYVSHKAYQSGIVLFDGKVSKIDDNLWKIMPYGISDNGQISNFSVSLNENSVNDEFGYKVVFSGKIVESYVDAGILISLMNLGWKNFEIGQNDILGQIVKNASNLEDSVNSTSHD